MGLHKEEGIVDVNNVIEAQLNSAVLESEFLGEFGVGAGLIGCDVGDTIAEKTVE